MAERSTEEIGHAIADNEEAIRNARSENNIAEVRRLETQRRVLAEEMRKAQKREGYSPFT
jgi:hypothetical protein